MLAKKGAFVIVADGGGATVYRVATRVSGVKLDDVECLDRGPAPSTTELGRDRPTRAFAPSRAARGAAETPDLHDEEERAFARVLADRLDAISGKARRGVILFAAPRFLGMLRPMMSDQTRSTLLVEVPKDLRKSPLSAIEKAVETLPL
jgi:protein required for attachment to host cells